MKYINTGSLNKWDYFKGPNIGPLLATHSLQNVYKYWAQWIPISQANFFYITPKMFYFFFFSPTFSGVWANLRKNVNKTIITILFIPVKQYSF